MSRESLHESMLGKGWEEIALDLACANERLEARVADLERKLQAVKIILARLDGQGCSICGALGDEPCDAGLHG